MRVDVVESLPVQDLAAVSAMDNAAVDRALRNFRAAIQSEESLFTCEVLGFAVEGGRLCSGDFVLKFRGASLASSRRLYFSLVEKLVELLQEAGSAESLGARICLTAESGAEGQVAGWVLRMHLEARGNSEEQAGLRWGLGVAHVQQALLFTSRYLRQQMGQSAD